MLQQIALSSSDALQKEQKVDQLLGALLESIAKSKPENPVQWMIDVLAGSKSVDDAVQKAQLPS